MLVLALGMMLAPAVAPASVAEHHAPAATPKTPAASEAEPNPESPDEGGTEPSPDDPSAVDPAPEDAGSDDVPVGLPSIDESSLEGPTLDDGVLPCGLRVLIAQDTTLPVAAVVLAIDTGTEDDPTTQPGLVHALAYHLLQGNRELPPGGAAALVQNRGGFATLAIGPAQVRYESLVPLSSLSDTLWAESQRLRAPTISAELWADSLRWARRDKPIRWRVPRSAIAAAHGVPGLEHEGRTVTTALDQMVPRAVGQAMAERFRYTAATLVVVSPHPPSELRAEITELFAELPDAPHHERDRMPRWRQGSVPQGLPIAGETGRRFVWPVAPDPAAIAQATVFCKAINRQRRRAGEPGRARVRCHLDFDPRRPTMVIATSGAEDPHDLLKLRVDRLEQGEDDRLIERQRESVRRDRVQQLRSALPLARELSAAGTRPSIEPGWLTRPTAAFTGLAELSQTWAGRRFGPRLAPGAAIQLMPEEGKP